MLLRQRTLVRQHNARRYYSVLTLASGVFRVTLWSLLFIALSDAPVIYQGLKSLYACVCLPD